MRFVVLSALVLGVILPAWAASPSCDDRLREVSVYADAVARARMRAELDAARAIADLLKQRDALRAELDALKAQKEP